MSRQSAFSHPFDTPASAGLRFFVEVIAWVAGPWAAAQQSLWLIVPALILLVGLPAIFSTPGDKRQIVVATSGPLRVILELGLQAVAIAGPWVIWPVWLAGAVTLVVAVALAAGLPRTLWLLRGAPAPAE